MFTTSLYCPCCQRSIQAETNLYYHLLTKHHRSELSAAIIELLNAQQERREQPQPLAPR
jgi:hypothetical protein